MKTNFRVHRWDTKETRNFPDGPAGEYEARKLYAQWKLESIPCILLWDTPDNETE